MTLGEKVRFRRTLLRISQPELSHQTGISQSYLSGIENGNYMPTAKILGALAKSLKCTTDYLIYDEKKQISETDGECDLQCYRRCNRCGQYHCKVIL